MLGLYVDISIETGQKSGPVARSCCQTGACFLRGRSSFSRLLELRGERTLTSLVNQSFLHNFIFQNSTRRIHERGVQCPIQQVMAPESPHGFMVSQKVVPMRQRPPRLLLQKTLRPRQNHDVTAVQHPLHDSAARTSQRRLQPLVSSPLPSPATNPRVPYR